MAITDGYATLAEARGYILPAGADTADDTRIEIAVEAASRAIDDFCNRRFYNASETRYYTAANSGTVYVDDLVSVTTLKADTSGDGTYDTTWATSDYLLEPFNASTAGRPYTRITVSPQGTQTFPSCRRGVEIVGTFGWPSAAPTTVKQACLIQAFRLFKRATEAPMGIAGMGIDGGGMRLMAKLDPDVELLVKAYKKIPSART